MLSEMVNEFPEVHFTFTDINTKDGELIKASFEIGLLPQIFFVCS